MFKQAVKNHSTTSPSTQPVLQQQSLSAFKHVPNAQNNGARSLTTGSGNILKHTSSTDGRMKGAPKGIKRTSSGLAKALGSHGDAFDYPSLNISDHENELSSHFFNPGQKQRVASAPVQFDEDDFESDIDLDVEDPATKGTVQYPTLPPMAPPARSPYVSSKSTPGAALELDSSQPIPWSSSPLDHFKTPPKLQPAQPTKRRTLPWLQSQGGHTRDSQEDPIEQESEEEEIRPRKRKSTEGTRPGANTPLHRNRSQAAYPWNTTASAVKQQQKSFREANKKPTKANEATEDGVKKAIEKKKRNTVHKIFLSDEQKHILQLVVEHQKSVFFTGSAGTGKSVLLREVIAALRRKHVREPDRVAVTASTGLAACNIGGVTLHSFAGIGLGKEDAEDLVKKIRRNQKARQRWLRTKVLIIDEVSMVDGELFDKLEQIARTIRNNGRPFGGIQLIITGDFFQLPPVPDSGRQARFAFDAGTWNTSVEHTIGLHHVFRQKDPVFAGMLNEMREGRLTQASIAKFRELERPLPATTVDIEATELFPTRQEVDRANDLRMSQLHGDHFSFEARDGGTVTDKTFRDRLLANCMAPPIVHLKKGAQVMLIKNLDDTLVNGSLGRVTGFMTEVMFNFYKENEEAFLNGDEERVLNGPTETEVRAQQKANILGVNTQQVYPVVRFSIADGTTRDLLCKRESWKVELPNGEVQASRDQIPLILAWALSIHKAQGQTLERVRVDLGRVFEKGQAYVALSRAVSMAGLQVMRFNPQKVMAHEKVRAFYNSLSRAEQAQAKESKKSVIGQLRRKAAEDGYDVGTSTESG